MSKAIYLCSRSHGFDEAARQKLLDICTVLEPDNILKQPVHRIAVEGRLAYAVTMDNSAVQVAGSSLLLGLLYEDQAHSWAIPAQTYPDGNYALFRSSDTHVEAVSDFSGSRTIWYYHDDDLFLAATSQRAIIMFLGTFFFDERVMPWMLSSGTLGPQFSWDRRLQRLQPDSSLMLDRSSWTCTLKQARVVFAEEARPVEDHRALLTQAMSRTVGRLDRLDSRRWILPLSGGYDSRALACLLRDTVGIPADLRAVTWGLQSSLDEEGNDANIAHELAGALGMQHEYYHTDLSSEPVETILDRFIACAEGRIDHLGGYMDGMEIWRRLHDSGIDGIIRGDEGFGWKKVSSEAHVRRTVRCMLCSDYGNLRDVFVDFDFPPQELPGALVRGQEESLEAWRDRLYHSYRIPSILAALTDIKLSYVEQVNPLLSRSILEIVRTVPDSLRTDKALFKDIVAGIAPQVPIAVKSANALAKNILRTEPLIDQLKRRIGGDEARGFFGTGFVDHILDELEHNDTLPAVKRRRTRKTAGSVLAGFVTGRRRRSAPPLPRLDGYVLAFRAYIIFTMHKNLQADAARVQPGPFQGRLLRPRQRPAS